MKNIEIKNEIHQFIDNIENQEFLNEFYIFIQKRFSKKNTLLIDTLSSDEKTELLKSYEESKNETNLLSNDSVKSQYKKWLK